MRQNPALPVSGPRSAPAKRRTDNRQDILDALADDRRSERTSASANHAPLCPLGNATVSSEEASCTAEHRADLRQFRHRASALAIGDSETPEDRAANVRSSGSDRVRRLIVGKDTRVLALVVCPDVGKAALAVPDVFPPTRAAKGINHRAQFIESPQRMHPA